jgi:hypothetical protein
MHDLATIEVLRSALRDHDCPRPYNDEPQDMTIGECVDKGQCGCHTPDVIRALATPAPSGHDPATIEACKAAICSGCASGVEINKAGFHQHRGYIFPCHATALKALATPADWQQDKAETSVLPRATLTEER